MTKVTRDNAVLCPRCERNYYTPYVDEHGNTLPMAEDAPYAALSRADNKTYICSACGVAEAMDDFGNAEVVPPEEWPVGVEGE